MAEPNKKTLYTEKVVSGDNARWPYDTSADPSYNAVMNLLKQQKQTDGFLFAGWKFNNELHSEPFNNENDNPFGPIESDGVEITAMWNQIFVFCVADKETVSYEGESVDIRFYAVVGNQIINNSEVTLVIESQTTVTYTTSAATTDGNWKKQTFVINPNQTTETKTLTLYAEYKGVKSETVVITQTANGDILLPSFDYMTFVYNWGENDGQDLDSATVIRDSNLMISSNTSLNNVYVGFNGNSSPNVQKYIQHGGDNQRSGNEGAFINWKKVITDMRNNDILEGVTELHLDVYANWYVSKMNGNMSVTFNTYESPNDTGMTLNEYVFTPNEGTTQVSSQISTRPINVYAFGRMNVGNTEHMKQTYSKVFEVTYYVQSKKAIVKSIRTQSGREITDIKYKYNGQEQYIDNRTSTKIKEDEIDKNPHSGTFTVSNFSQKVNGVVDNAYTINPDEITLSYYSPMDMTGYVTFTASVNDGVCTVNWTCQENNTAATKRNCDINIKVHTAPCDYTLIYSIYQTN